MPRAEGKARVARPALPAKPARTNPPPHLHPYVYLESSTARILQRHAERSTLLDRVDGLLSSRTRHPTKRSIKHCKHSKRNSLLLLPPKPRLLLATVQGEPRREKRPLTPNGLVRALFAVLPIEERKVVRPEGVLDKAALDQVVKVLLPVQTPESGTRESDAVRARGVDEAVDVLDWREQRRERDRKSSSVPPQWSRGWIP